MKFEFSAGGVVFKKEKGEVTILLAKHSQNKSWGFPKGLIGDTEKNETKESTAIREVKEETGVEAFIIKPLDSTTYFYEWNGEKRKKTVYYFLMECINYNFDERDFEMEEVKWVNPKDVENILTFEADKKIWKQAQREIKLLGF